jgi:23S rRNA (cytidine1920-2'-O)/16S rRNA (cytidine1409-2'-O)-methyltransferase
VQLIAIDVAFISATLVLPAVINAVQKQSTNFEAVVLVKPQFEAGRDAIGKGGIVRDPQAQLESVQRVRGAVQILRGTEIEVIDSPILGAEGNREFLLHSRFN